MSFIIPLAILSLFLPLVITQAPANVIQNPCVSKGTCHECIRTPTCAWCWQPDFQQRSRCFQPSGGQNVICSEEYVYNPHNEQAKLISKPLSKAHATIAGEGGYAGSASGSMSGMSGMSGSASSGSEIVQVSPQRMQLKLRAKQSFTFEMMYTQAEDYPVDLYYLMDLSKSMEDDKEKLSKLGSLLVDTMSNVTSNFRLGFGSFVDKVVMPYVSTVPSNLIEPCKGCAAPYGFRNVMRLSTDGNQFSRMVSQASVSGNLDAPEGGFDAIMQAVVCRQEIGWREKARRLLVFSTDAGFHYAGDGKLGGIITPNDGECHLRHGLYTHSDLLDYPSISQINLKVKQNAINVIFAVTESQINVYKRLQEHIEGSSCGQLSSDSSNIVDLVKNQYEQITSTVEMKDNATSAVKMTYFSQCLNTTQPEWNTNKCSKIKVGDVVTFKIQIELLECPQNPNEWNQTIQIYPVGLNESLIIDLKMQCACPCEMPGHIGYEENSPTCHNSGTYKCGVCDCDKGAFGRYCECSTEKTETEDFKGCRQFPNSTVDCSGRGTCTCGRCECNTRDKEDEIIDGDYCECDNFSCDRHQGLLCSGPTHSSGCVCGTCICKPPWTGAACECTTATDTCYAPDNADACSGRGECVCGACQCRSSADDGEDVRYSGRFCEKCPTCSDRCEALRDCVMCQSWKTGPFKDNCTEACVNATTPISVEYIDKNEDNDETLCTFLDENDCRFYYVYYFDNDKKEVIKAQKDLECPPKVLFTGIIFGVIAAIVLMGMAILLLWKLLTTIHDRREFAKFEKERMMAKWDASENPIYKQATSTFKNPTYAGKG